jgi:hypothetical protein
VCFIAIYTHNEKHLFAEILPAKELGISTMQLYELRQLAEKY